MSTSATVLSGKGGCAKTFWQLMLAAEASRDGVPTLLVDADPERNLSNRFKVSKHAGGLGSALEAAGVTGDGDFDARKGAAKLVDELVVTSWPDVTLLPAGASLNGISQITIADTWLLRDILEEARVGQKYALVLIDTAGRSGSLVTQAMYAGDVAYAPISPTEDAVKKAWEARERVHKIQRAHQLRWAGVVLSAFDRRVGMDMAIRDLAYETFGEEVHAEVPRRSQPHEAFQLTERLGDRRDIASAGLAGIFGTFLHEHLLQDRPVSCEVAR